MDKQLTQEIATSTRNPFDPVFDGLIRPNDDTLASRGGGRGIRIYDELERDAHVYSVMQKRKLAVVGREWSLDAASDSAIDQAAAELVTEQFRNMNFDGMCLHLLDAILKGYAVGEVMWRADAASLVLDRFLDRDARRFVFNDKVETRLLTMQALTHGEAVPERKFIVHRFGAKDGNPYGLGLGTRLFWLVFFKRQSIQFWLTFADKFGSPTALGKYRSGTPLPDQKKLLAALTAISQESQIAIPEGMEVELLEAQRSGTVNTYESLCRYMDEEISKAVLGEIHTTGGGASGLGGGRDQVANDVRLELTKADADLLAATLNNTLVKWIVEFNLPGAAPPRLSWDVSEPEDLKSRADRDKIICDMGFDPDDDYIRETYGEGWTRKPAAPPVVPKGLLSPAELSAAPERMSLTNQHAERLSRSADAPVGDWLIVLKKLLGECKTLTEFRDRLAEVYPKLSADQFADLMADAMAAAELGGRVDILEQAGLVN